MSDVDWINATLTAARAQAIGALLRYFRDLDTAEEAFQDACLRALKSWPQIGPALRIVSGLSVRQIARAFLVGEAAMEQRITRAKARIAQGGVPFETPGAVERAERL